MKERFECLDFALQHETVLRNSIRGAEALSIFELAELVFQFVDGAAAKDVTKTAKSIQRQRINDALKETGIGIEPDPQQLEVLDAMIRQMKGHPTTVNLDDEELTVLLQELKTYQL